MELGEGGANTFFFLDRVLRKMPLMSFAHLNTWILMRLSFLLGLLNVSVAPGMQNQRKCAVSYFYDSFSLTSVHLFGTVKTVASDFLAIKQCAAIILCVCIVWASHCETTRPHPAEYQLRKPWGNKLPVWLENRFAAAQCHFWVYWQKCQGLEVKIDIIFIWTWRAMTNSNLKRCV